MAGKTPELTKQAELTKQRFLDAGLKVLRSRGLGSGIDNIRLADVAERLQLSATVAYKIWGGKGDAGEGGQERYRRDLAAHAIENVTRGASESVVAASAVLVQTEASLSEILRSRPNWASTSSSATKRRRRSFSGCTPLRRKIPSYARAPGAPSRT